jgi:hypothetical protein
METIIPRRSRTISRPEFNYRISTPQYFNFVFGISFLFIIGVLVLQLPLSRSGSRQQIDADIHQHDNTVKRYFIKNLRGFENLGGLGNSISKM